MIDIFLITGFLGSGKTSFLNNILKNRLNSVKPNEKTTKIAIIENEFGEVGFDGNILKENTDKNSIVLEEISNGSIFCSCRHENFIEALYNIGQLNLDEIWIEASGISDPSPIKNNIEFVKQKRKFPFNYKGSVCLIDSVNFLDQVQVLESIKRQIIHSNILLLNKIDLISTNILKQIKEKITEIKKEITSDSTNKTYEILETEYGQIPTIEFYNALNKTSTPKSEESINHPDTGPIKLVITSNKILKKNSILEFLNYFSPQTLRIKGYIKCLEGIYYIDCVGGLVNLNLKEELPMALITPVMFVVIIRSHEFALGDAIKDAFNHLS